MTNQEKSHIDISNKMRVDQLKMLDIYEEVAESDPKFRKFLVEMAAKLNKILHKLDTKENEEKE